MHNNVATFSPDINMMVRRISTPANKYTGIMNINIPIYTMQTSGGNVSVGLNYYSSGTKVDEYATTVGLGWKLNGGGKITRVI